ncbi:MAG: hypothetical protein JW982_11590 [Spirochaetes bacterium]|nr:hypothetical protein [Spirochaetota bacterium]
MTTKSEKEQLMQEIEKAVISKNEIVITSHSILDNIDEIIQFIIKKSLKIENNDIISPVFSCLKEIITNALKANLRKMVMDKYHYSPEDDSVNILNELKKALTEKELQKYTLLSRDIHLFISIHFSFNNSDYLKIKIVNPVSLSNSQLERINLKISRARDYESLAHFYMENPDPLAEGMGLGLSMVIVMLKGLGINPDNLTIDTNKLNRTTAVLKIPYNISSGY